MKEHLIEQLVQLTSLFNVLVYIYQEQKHTIHKSQLSFTYRHAQQRMPNSDCHSQNINMITPKKHKYDYALLSTLWIRDSCSPVGENEYVYSDFQDDNGGVSESSQVLVFWGYRSPWTSPAVAYDSSSAISSGVSFTDRAPTFWSKFSIFVVPGMGQTSLPWWWTQANASCDGVHPFLVAIALTRSNIRAFFSRFCGWNLGKCCKNLKFSVKEPTSHWSYIPDYSKKSTRH